MKNKKKLNDIIEERNLEYLFHFTRTENLNSILNEGLIPRSKLNSKTALANDEYRYDECKNANCLSVEFPNYKMFWPLRCDNRDTKWVVLVLDIKLLKKFDCAYCYSNAGSEEMYSTPLQDRMTIDAFEGIFAERDEYPSRRKLNIPDYYPTNPQAEILVFGTISPKYIKGVIFESSNDLKLYKKIIPPDIKSLSDKKYFFPRNDFRYWQKIEV